MRVMPGGALPVVDFAVEGGKPTWISKMQVSLSVGEGPIFFPSSRKPNQHRS